MLMIAIMVFAIGVLFTVLGWLMWKKPPRKVNPLYGYRTIRSMKSQAAWDYAQVYAGRLMCIWGIVLAAAGIPLCWFVNINPEVTSPVLVVTLIIAPVLAATIIPLYFTERKLKALFDNEGQPKK